MTEKMKPQNSKVFHNLLTRDKKKPLNNNNIYTFNNKIIS